MKNKRSLIPICLLGAVLLLALPAVGQAQFTFTTNADNTITITGYTGSSKNVTIPDTISGLPVTSIGINAFYGKSGLTNIVIPNSVANIGDSAFYNCSGLPGITIPNNVTNIGRYIFYQCTSLTNVDLGNSIPKISDFAFYSCGKLTSVIIPNSVTNIGTNAFGWCSKLTSVMIPSSVISIGNLAFSSTILTNVTIPNGVISIGNKVFSHCFNLTSITIPSSVTSMGNQVFVSCESLNAISVDPLNAFYCSVAGVLFNKSQTMLIQYPSLKAGSNYTIPKSVASIGDYAFLSCPNLKGVYFQDNPPSVGLSIFLGTSSATVYYLPLTTGWGATFGGRPTKLWNPQAQNDASFGVQANQFGFNIAGSSNLVIVVEASADLANPVWSPVSTNTLNTFIGTNGTSYFSDAQWTNYPGRFYRLRSP